MTHSGTDKRPIVYWTNFRLTAVIFVQEIFRTCNRRCLYSIMIGTLCTSFWVPSRAIHTIRCCPQTESFFDFGPKGLYAWFCRWHSDVHVRLVHQYFLMTRIAMINNGSLRENYLTHQKLPSFHQRASPRRVSPFALKNQVLRVKLTSIFWERVVFPSSCTLITSCVITGFTVRWRIAFRIG